MSGKLPIANIQKGDGKIISAPLTSVGGALEFIGKTYEKDVLLNIVLTIDDQKADYTEIEGGGGGAEEFIIPVTITEGSPPSGTTDIKFDEVENAIENDLPIKFVIEIGTILICNKDYVYIKGDAIGTIAILSDIVPGYLTFAQIVLDDNNTITVNLTNIAVE